MPRLMRLPQKSHSASMSYAAPLFLDAKLAPPRFRGTLVTRTNLDSWLAESKDARLVRICAPAGFGKTTLMQQWRERLLQQGRAVAWLNLDQGDHDPGLFFSCLAAALSSLKDSSKPQSLQSVNLLDLLDILTSSKQSLTIFLDDFETIEHSKSLDAVQELVSLSPPGVQFVLGMRNLPAVIFEDICPHGGIYDIDISRLRFSLEETGMFVDQVQKLQLDKEEIEYLQEFTEGWVTGLQLSTLAQNWRGLPNHTGQPFAGAMNRVSEYLAEDVLAAQPEEVQNFLIQTSILKRLCASLCDLVTGRDDSETMLKYLDNANLFLVPLDEEGRWYRYHGLFARFLEGRFERGSRLEAERLNRLASSWYVEQGDLLDGIRHSLAAGDSVQAATLMNQCAMSLARSGQILTVIEWGDSLSLTTLECHPQLMLAYGHALVFRQQFEKANEILERLKSSEGATLTPEEEGVLYELRALTLIWQDRLEEFADILKEGLESERSVILSEHAGWLNYVAWYKMVTCDLDAAERLVTSAARVSRTSQNLTGAEFSQIVSAMLAMSEGRLCTAKQVLEALLTRDVDGIGRYSAGGAVAAVLLSEILYEGDQVDAAETLLEPYLSLLPHWSPPDIIIIGLRTMARIRYAKGDYPGAMEHLTKLKHIASGNKLERALASTRQEEIRMRLQSRDMEGAKRLSQGHNDEQVWRRFSQWQLLANDPETPMITRLRLMIASGDLGPALEGLRAELRRAQLGRRLRQVILLRILLAKTLELRGEKETALAVLAKAVSDAQENDILRVFVDEGPPIPQILYALRQENYAEQKKPTKFLDRLIAACEDSTTGDLIADDGESPVLYAPLTKMEIEILRVLGDGASNEELAAEFSVSINTIRYHLRNINSKIGANSRYQAIVFARRLGLIK